MAPRLQRRDKGEALPKEGEPPADHVQRNPMLQSYYQLYRKTVHFGKNIKSALKKQGLDESYFQNEGDGMEGDGQRSRGRSGKEMTKKTEKEGV